MRKIRSMVISAATVLMIAFMILMFIPGLTCKVNAAGDVIEVDTEAELKAALGSTTSKGKTIKVKDDISIYSSVTICTSLTLDLNNNEICFCDDYYLIINTKDESDTVIINAGDLGEGFIGGNTEGSLIRLNKGKLVIESGYIANYSDNGSCLDPSKNIMMLSGYLMSVNSLCRDIIVPLGFTISYNDGKYEIISVIQDGFSVCAESVTTDNCDDILGNGVFSYDLWTKTLYIHGDYDYGGKKIISSYINDLTVNVSERSVLDGYLYFYDITTITGNNKLILNSNDSRLITAPSLTIKDVSLELNGKYGIYMNGDSQSYGDCCLMIDNSEVTINSNYGAITFLEDTDLKFEGCGITEPDEWITKTGGIYESDGSAYVSTLKICPPDYYEPSEYSWSSDLKKCTATRVHKYDSTLNETETVDTTSVVKKEATETEKGTTTYTAKFENKAFETQTKDVQDIPVKQPDPSTPGSSTPSTSTPAPSTPGSSTPAPSNTSTGGGFEEFVERLYTVALNRASEPEGKAFWCEHVGNGDLNGAQCANEFLLSKEFNDRGLDDKQFLEVLYKTFFNRDAADDPDGFNFWMNSLKTQGRDVVVDCFINSEEWCNVCASYGVKSGATRAKATIASKNATAFATRLYTECLGRDPEEGGLKFWSLGLTNLELTGKQAAHEFFFSKEFNDFNLDNEGLLTRMYKTFMGREPDDDGMNYWLKEMSNGMTKEQVFDNFVNSKEFTEICQKYAIDRG
ncbi:MAG: DUF4214 domain-containing protein [Clostridiales bacterium]|nr:DUF4214 domain-containing protein [Clostridiales bacterium]